MNDNDDRSEATIIHHGVRQHDHDVTSRRRVCSSDDEPKVSLSLLLIEEEWTLVNDDEVNSYDESLDESIDDDDT